MLNIAHSWGFCIRATRALVSRHQLAENLAYLRSKVKPGTEICAAVKADAYGHGAVLVAKALEEERVERLAVATVEEGWDLRKAGITLPILLYGALQDEEWSQCAELNLQPFLMSLPQLEQLAQAAKAFSVPLKVHLKVDTGMGRLGCRPEQVLALARQLVHNPWLEFEGLATHFASSEGPGPVSVEQQLAKFQLVRDELAAHGYHPGVVHAANSGAILGNQAATFTMVRPGISLYGYHPAGRTSDTNLLPVMNLVSRVAFVKQVPAGTALSYNSRYVTSSATDVATIPIGYADGYRRSFSNTAPLVIGGKRFHVAGTVCMDQFLVDLGADSGVKAGDEVVLMGGPTKGDFAQGDGDQPPTADDLAVLAGTISYEILCGLSRRIPRVLVT